MSEARTRPSITILVPTDSPNKNEHLCDECTRLFKTKKELKDHICANPEEKSHVCELCGQRFAAKSHLRMHKKFLHGPKQFMCKEGCGKSFVRKSDLEAHYIAHIQYRPFRCKLCGRRFKAQNILRRHKRVHETDATFVNASELKAQYTTSDSESDVEEHPERKVRVFTCDVCNRHFRRNFNLKKHISTHAARSFVCAVCVPEVIFEKVSEREDHYKIVHSGKPFTCGECFKSYTSKSGLKRHLETHL